MMRDNHFKDMTEDLVYATKAFFYSLSDLMYLRQLEINQLDKMLISYFSYTPNPILKLLFPSSIERVEQSKIKQMQRIKNRIWYLTCHIDRRKARKK